MVIKQRGLRLGAVGIGLAAMMLIASGCSTTATSTKPTATAKASGPITVWVGSWWQPQIPVIVKAWEQDHPDIPLTIDALPQDNYLQKFTTADLGGDPPDIVDLQSSWVPTVAAQGLVQPLGDVVSKSDIPDFFPALWDASKLKGVQYALPDRAYAAVLYFNKTLFDQAGLAYPDNSTSYATLLSDAQKLTTDGVSGFGYSASAVETPNLEATLYPIIYDNGGEILNKDNTKAEINSKKSVAGITYWADLYTKYHVTPAGTPNLGASRDLEPLFDAGKLAMFAQVSGTYTDLMALKSPPNFGMALMPGTHQTVAGGWSMSVPVGAKNPTAAREFLKWFAEPKNLAALMNRTPARISSNKIAPWTDPTTNPPIFTEALKYAKADPNVPNYSNIQSLILVEAQKILVGQETPKQGADAMAAQINTILASNKARGN